MFFTIITQTSHLGNLRGALKFAIRESKHFYWQVNYCRIGQLKKEALIRSFAASFIHPLQVELDVFQF